MTRARLLVSLSSEAVKSLKARARRQNVRPFAVIEELLRWADRMEAAAFHEAPVLPEGPGRTVDGPEPTFELPAPLVNRLERMVEERPIPELSDRTLRVPLPSDLRDPLSPDAPGWVQALGAAVRDGKPVTAEQREDLKAWMRSGYEKPATTLADAIARPDAPIRGHVPEAFGDVPPESGIGSQPDPVPENAPPDPEAPDYVPPTPYVPPVRTRTYLDAGAPAWVVEVGEAIVEGSLPDGDQGLVALSKWMQGIDVEAPKGWPKAEQAVRG